MREFDNLPFPMGTGSSAAMPNNSTNNNNSNSLGPAAMMPGSHALQQPMHHHHHSNHHANPNGAAIVPPSMAASSCGARAGPSDSAWRENGGEDLRRLRSRSIVLIERMLRNHQPHDVLTQVPENYDWRSKTFLLAIKIEKLMFLAATSRENYLNEHTLRSRVQLLSRHLVRIRKRKNAMAAATSSAATAV